jgi:hypothetical protein
MAHAQRLLPLEQLLSEAGVMGAPRPAGKPTIVPEARKSESQAATRSASVSPFAADSARKSGSKPELSTETPPAASQRVFATGTANAVVMGSAAPAVLADAEPEVTPEPDIVPEGQSAASSDDLRLAVLNALADAGHRMLTSMLETGEWRVEGNELTIKVSASPAVIDMSLGADARRLMIATASGVRGRALKLKVSSGANPQSPATVRPVSNGGGRGRAEQDPVVRRMKEKFGAEIRTIIDYREKDSKERR